MTGRVADKVAVVTGAGSGIGAATAQVLAAEGASVTCADIDLAAAEVTASAIEAAGGRACAHALDVADPDANEACADATVERFGALHIAHLNAGIGSMGGVLDVSIDDWDRCMAINLRGVFLGMQSFGRRIASSGGGSIIATASVAGLLGGAAMSAYCATKFGVVGLVKAASADLAPHRIRVNAVCPGVIDTAILGPIHGNEPILEVLGKGHPIGRVGQPEEVGRLVTFLASDDASFLTGGAFPVDGGLSATIGALSPQ